MKKIFAGYTRYPLGWTLLILAILYLFSTGDSPNYSTAIYLSAGLIVFTIEFCANRIEKALKEISQDSKPGE